MSINYWFFNSKSQKQCNVQSIKKYMCNCDWHMPLLFRFLNLQTANLQTQHTDGWVDTDPALQYVKLLSDVA